MAHQVQTVEKETYTPRPKVLSILLGLSLVGLLAFGLGLYFNPTRAWVNFLVATVYMVSLGLGGIFFVSVQNAVKSSWATPFKRIPEAMSAALPWGALAAGVLLAGMHQLYEWTHADVVAADPILTAKLPFLNIKFFIIRMVIYFVGWLLFARAITGISLRQDQTGDINLSHKITAPSVGFLIFFGFSYCLFSYDTVMSLEPHWFSTIFGPYLFAGLFVSSMAFMGVILIGLKAQGHFVQVNENHLHDLGKMIFGFSIFWAYIWISQFLLIWYSNIPEETVYFALRFEHGWKYLFILNLLWNWFIPFLVLLPRGSKRNSAILGKVCIWLLVGRWLDLYLMIAPGPYEHHGMPGPSLGLIEIFMGLGSVSFVAWLTLRRLSRHPLLPKNDPNYQEGLHLHQ